MRALFIQVLMTQLLLRSAARISLIFVFDGAREAEKAATQHERRDGKLAHFSRAMHQLHDSEFDGAPERVEVSASARSLMMPHLTISAMIESLRVSCTNAECGLAVMCACNEGDAAIAQLCARLEADGVLALDSDFYFHVLAAPSRGAECALAATVLTSDATKGRYIPLDSLQFRESGEIVAMSYKRDTIAAYLGLSSRPWAPALPLASDDSVERTLHQLFFGGVVSEISLLACLVGNDHTLHSQWITQFHDRLSALPVLAVRVVKVILNSQFPIPNSEF